MTALSGWENFYVIAGSSAGALIGLQFVVLSLIANWPMARSDADAGRAFATPTIVHFVAVLGLSGIASAPWDGAGAAAILWGIVGLSGVVYAVIVTRFLEQLRERLEKFGLELHPEKTRVGLQYHAIPGNGARLKAFRNDVQRIWYQARALSIVAQALGLPPRYSDSSRRTSTRAVAGPAPQIQHSSQSTRRAVSGSTAAALRAGK